MLKKIQVLAAGLALAVLFGGCGTEDPELTKFKNDVESFCSSLSDLDASMNSIDADSENAPAQLLEYLDEVDLRFQGFADLDFPAEFDYLESLADEAGDYMSEAVEYYHLSYSNGSYNEYTAEYAQENYSRAIKRIKIILAFLRGETPDEDDISITYETPAEGDSSAADNSDSSEDSVQ